MLKAVFGWFDAHPGSYWIIASAAAVLLAGWIAYGFTRRGSLLTARRHAIVTGLILLGVLFAWRWPALLGTQELNPDESQLIAGAITLEYDPVFFRSVDGTTSGPLNFYALLPTHWLGIPQDFFNARLTGLLLVWGSLWAGYALLRREFGPAVAVLGLLPGLTLFATATDSDFIHYTSEHVSLLLIMLSGWLLWTAHKEAGGRDRHPLGRWLAAGVFMGMLPWAKLQAAPIAAALAAWGTWLALSRTALPWRQRWLDVLRLALAALSPSVGFLAMIVIFGQWTHFWRCYIENNLIYASTNIEFWAGVAKLYHLSTHTGNFIAFLAGPAFTVGVAVVACLFYGRKPGPLFWSGLILSVAAFAAVVAPRQGFHHYVLFLVPTLTWWAAAAMGVVHQSLDAPRKRLMLGLAFALIAAGMPIAVRSRLPVSPMFGQFLESWRNPYSEPAKVIRQLRQPGDFLAVWGWDCQIYVETGLPHATREAHSTRQLWDSSQRDSYYRPRYLQDITARAPTFFVDAVGPKAFFFHDRFHSAHETFAELRDYVAANYVMLEDFKRLRIYIRKDRAPQGAE